MKSLRDEKDKAMKQQQAAFDKKEQQRASEEKKKVAALEKKIKDLESRGPGPVGKTAGVRGAIYWWVKALNMLCFNTVCK